MRWLIPAKVPGEACLDLRRLCLKQNFSKVSMMDIDEPIHLESHDPAWPRYFEQERNRMSVALGLDMAAI